MTDLSDDEPAVRIAIAQSVSRHVEGASERDCEQLFRYLMLLQKWNATYNLTAVRGLDQMVRQHLADCLAVVGPLRRVCARSNFRLLDVGSGGGLPGVVIALMNPPVDVVCVDAVGKKAAFVRQVASELRLANLVAVHQRAERLDAPPFDIITSRAFSSLASLVSVSRHSLAPDGAWMAMKARLTAEELQAAKTEADVFHVEQLAVPEVQAERCLVWMRPSVDRTTVAASL